MNIKASQMQQASAEAAEMLKLLAHPKRLLLLCALLEQPMPVGELAGVVGLRESSTSQQLALLREAGLVQAQREGQVMRYRLAHPAVKDIIKVLHKIYCKE